MITMITLCKIESTFSVQGMSIKDHEKKCKFKLTSPLAVKLNILNSSLFTLNLPPFLLRF